MSVGRDSVPVAVIGGGPAGLTAGIYLARAGLGPVVLERGLPGGQVALTFRVENYPGFPEGLSGPELASRLESQARRLGAQLETAEVERVELGEGGFVLRLEPEGTLRARAVVVASGSRPRRLGVPGEEALGGRGVSYCATCDGPLFSGRDVVVVGGGDSALEEALYLARHARQVTVVHRRGQLRAAAVIQQRARAHPRIRLLLNAVVEEVLGDDAVAGVRVRDLSGGGSRELKAEGVFIYIGGLPNTGFLPPEVRRDSAGYLLTGDDLQTSLSGLFAAGDVRQKRLRQVATAVGDGALAALGAQRFLEGLD
ncbi:MAG: thioredoxin-disulfide reductase [Acetobacteraceae bacterium]|nr:thioredoxin-disulfide reductase [Acetobacteraceae bacterium]